MRIRLLLLVGPILFAFAQIKAQNVVKAEYFVDVDPGIGAATDIPITASPSISNINFSKSLTALTDGLHQMYFRVKDVNGVWSTTERSPFYRLTLSTSTPPPAVNITNAEYFIDTDPGIGSGKAIVITAGLTITDLIFQVDVSALTQGNHTLFVRFKDANGNWSVPEASGFSVCNQAVPVAAAATSLSVSGFTANWGAATGATGYSLDVSTDNFATLVSGYSKLSVLATTQAVTGLTVSVLYSYRVRAVNATCTSVNSNTISVTTLSQTPTISNFNPTSGAVGTSVTITGTNFSTTPSNNLVKFKGTTATITGTPTATSIVATVPTGATTGKITVEVGGQVATSAIDFTVTTATSPTIASFNPTSGVVGASVTITGTNFSTTAANNLVKFNGTTSTISGTPTATSIVATVPTGATTGKITVEVSGQIATSASDFTVTTATSPTIASFNPTSGVVGASVTITGTNFSTTAANNLVKFNGTTATITGTPTAASIVATVPTGATTGKITVEVGGQVATSAIDFTVTTATSPTIASFNPTSGAVGASVTITGTNFSTTAANNIVKFNGTAASITGTPTATSIVATVPTGATTGKITVEAGGQVATSATDFTVTTNTSPTIASFNPTSGAVGASVTITGTNFSTTAANNLVKFNGTAASITGTPTATSIVATVATGATTGKITVEVGGQVATSAIDFTVTSTDATAPTVTDNTAQTVNLGAAITITATITDSESAISAANVEFRSIAAGGTTTTRALTKAVNTYSASIAVAEIGEVGIEYKLSATSVGGTFTSSSFKSVSVNHNSGLDIPIIRFGNEIGNYRIISIPLDLLAKSVNSVFDEMDAYDKKKWRMYRYDNGATSELNGNTPIVTGQGYWFIARANPGSAINSGAGNSVAASSISPFEVNLKADWNQIGNPYNFNLSWADVVAANPGIGLPAAIRLYDGDFVDGDRLKKMEGGFVKVTTAGKLKFPVVKNPAFNSRIDETPKRLKNPIDNPDWEVRFSISQGEWRNSISGFGMNRKASDRFDAFDGFNMPRFLETFLELNHTKKEGTDYYSADIVTTKDNQVWEFDVESNAEGNIISLGWDNSYFGQNDRELYLWDVALQRVVNMRTASTYTFDRKISKSFRAVYGSKAFVKQETSVAKLVFHAVWPNPVEENMTVAFSLPQDSVDEPITFALVDMFGRKVWEKESQFNGGYNEAVFLRSNESKSGIYILKVSNRKVSAQARVVFK